MKMKDLNDSMQAHLQEIRGVPLSIEDIAVRFVTYSAMLTQFHEVGKNDIDALVALSKKVQLTLQAVTSKTAN